MLRTLDMLSGYDIQATDGEIGSVDDFLFDDESWKIRYLVVDTGPWLFGRQVLVAPEWIDEIGWERSLVRVKMERDAIKESPEYEPGMTLGRDYERRLHKHYGMQGYWTWLNVTGAGV